MCNRISIIFFLILGIVFLRITEGRPRIRHHKGDSKCSRCGPGWGVTKICTPYHDTECNKCEHGTYSPHHNLQSCWLCSRCGPGLYEAHPCTPKTDTVCDSCHRHALDNLDYQKKCKGHKNLFLAPEDARSTGEESSLVNEEDENIDEKEREEILRDDIRAELLDEEKFNEESSS
ncbi:tumor necrosis factor receptor superfamily member 4-like [Chelonus insularis]|uniref:tumor necrosis factor receptor superfamily member 4-like n=1 Tax=Chelonus insularis TaxID=460826 RepID=UPI00158F2E38|nr:tumor necrosis factor receptor superfamily member 4-like [Chelonus insularis]